jgi:hypothetical protein
MVADVIKLLGTGLSLWEHKEKNKYVDKYMRLKQEHYEESNKPDHLRDDGRLDRIVWELQLLSSGFCALASKSDAQNKS